MGGWISRIGEDTEGHISDRFWYVPPGRPTQKVHKATDVLAQNRANFPRLVIQAPRFCGRKAICLLTLLTYRSEMNYALSAKVYLFGLCMCENQPDCRGQNSESKWQ